jgi:protein SCO1/2
MQTNTTIRTNRRPAITVVVMVLVWCTFGLLPQSASSMDAGIDGKGDADMETSVVDDDPSNLRSIPEEGQDIGVDTEKIGTVIDANLKFRDSNNSLVRLADLFDGSRPIMMSFNYSDCPKLCSVQLENMNDSLREVDFTVGKDFDFISISIDPNEQSVRAKENKAKYLKRYNRPESAPGWHFWTGDRDAIANITDQTGFRFKYVREQKLFSHPPVFILFSPEGKIVRYIHGLSYDPKTIKQALVEAASGKIGSPINYASYALGCFSYNDSTGQYTFQAMSLMRIGGFVTTALLLFGLAPYWFFRRQAAGDRGSADGQQSLGDQTGTLNDTTG